MNCRMLLALVSDYGLHDQLAIAIQDGDYDRFLVYVHAEYLTSRHVSCLLGVRSFVQPVTPPQGKSVILQGPQFQIPTFTILRP